MIAIVDYGVGNLFSLKSSFAKAGAEICVSSDAEEIRRAQRLVLPGVGAFANAMDKLHNTGLDRVLVEEVRRGKPLLGICLGMQLLFEKSYEYGENDGLGLLPGKIRPILDVIPRELKVPHMGWNALHFAGPQHPLFRYIREGDHVYFVHSYQATGCRDSLIATTEYGAPLTAAVALGHVMGCQFHPEKSGTVGLGIVKAFTQYTGGVLC